MNKTGVFLAGRMNRPTTKLNTTESSQEDVDTDSTSTKHFGSEKHHNVQPDPAGPRLWTGFPSDVSLPGIFPHPHQGIIQPTLMDTVNLSSVPGPSSSSYHSSISAPWLNNECLFYNMMPVDLPAPVTNIHVAQAMGHQQVWEGLSEVTPHFTQPVVCNVYGSGQVAAIDICEPTFTTSHNCSAHADVSVLGTPSQYYQAACRLYESNMQPQDPLGRAAGTVCESEPRKPCHCSRSKCLQLYCECFANGVMCSNCDCSNCYNNAEHEVRRYEAIKLYLGRNPDAFRPKIAGGESGKVKGWHIKGCSCQRSRCLKNYCECFEANIKCTSSCKCVGCRNYDERSEMDPIEKTCKDKGPASVITTAMVEDVCNHLVAQAEKAEREGQSPIQAERMVLVEFGHCLTQIVKSMFKDK
uniref:CRC domain-containing protein n=1 Tax=Monopterus albus TaxID=43700 RepID=A0A3Q3J3L1_MONAL